MECNKFIEEAIKWIGTPYRIGKPVCKRGSDCSLFIAESLLQSGLIEKYDHIEFSRDWYVHNKNSQILLNHVVDTLQQNLKPQFKFTNIPYNRHMDDPRPGDILLFSLYTNSVRNHAAICINEKLIIHCVVKEKVKYTPFDEFYKRRLRNIIRIYKE